VETCFVMQPFDGGPYDKRYEDVFSPAIQEAQMEPYRVDNDPTVIIPIDEIEAGIRRADYCLAEISTDNPNVWFELGFAIASGKRVVLVCSEDRKTAFPFDVRHRLILKYKTESSRDFDKLRQGITEKLVAAREKKIDQTTIDDLSPLAKTQGLSEHEMVALVVVAQSSICPDDLVSAYKCQGRYEQGRLHRPGGNLGNEGAYSERLHCVWGVGKRQG